jgi:tetratricopeptide (TPR) repeat protein
MRLLTFLLVAFLIPIALPSPVSAEAFKCGSFPLLDDTISKEERADRLLKHAIACVQEGKPQESIALFSELIGLDPDNETAYLNRGNAYIQTGQFELGVADYSHVIAKNPGLSQGWYNRGTAFIAARQ